MCVCARTFLVVVISQLNLVSTLITVDLQRQQPLVRSKCQRWIDLYWNQICDYNLINPQFVMLPCIETVLRIWNLFIPFKLRNASEGSSSEREFYFSSPINFSFEGDWNAWWKTSKTFSFGEHTNPNKLADWFINSEPEGQFDSFVAPFRLADICLFPNLLVFLSVDFDFSEVNKQ